MDKPRIKPKKERIQQEQVLPGLKISNPGKLPDIVKQELALVRGALKQMIDQYIDDTVLYVRSGHGDKNDLVNRGTRIKKMLDGIDKNSIKGPRKETLYPQGSQIKR